MSRRIDRDWRLWTGLCISTVLLILAVLIPEIRQVWALRAINKSRAPNVHWGHVARTPRLPAFVVHRIPLPWSNQLFVRVESATINGYVNPPTELLIPFSGLKHLVIHNPKSMTDTQWADIAQLQSLETIECYSNGPLSVAGIESLKRLPHLKKVLIDVSDLGESELQAFLGWTSVPLIGIYGHEVAKSKSPTVRRLRSQKNIQIAKRNPLQA